MLVVQIDQKQRERGQSLLAVNNVVLVVLVADDD